MAKSEVDKLMAALSEASANGDKAKAKELAKQFTKAVAADEKANAEKYAEAKAACADWMAEKIATVVAEASSQFDIGDTIQQLKWTAAGFAGSDGVQQTNNSVAINPKRGGGGGSSGGNGNGGERGNVLGTGLSMRQIVDQHGTAEEIASYNSTDDKNVRYSIVRKIVKRING